MASDWHVPPVDPAFIADTTINRAWLEIDSEGKLFQKVAPQGQPGGSVITQVEQPKNGDPVGHGAGQGRLSINVIPNWYDNIPGGPIPGGFVSVDAFFHITHKTD